ncbi:hypothetical protein N7537_009518 [Penicillium hordei]|uniref:Uncharacterized protein n=1 Tax=Penicillium hordei TaxID=40994 RepID=A0AAD6DUC5_9EURO|nr:uncharacterized protein N7537_009518 [Penicillium hordei]KAJ5592614.1 hypothetical protein N7537_009518 [Penicillium hordei]
MPHTGGYALRRNASCLSTETDCGGTTPPFHGCCPGYMFCPGPQYNVICCPSNADCSRTMAESCADSKADLYSSNSSDLANEGFCCERGRFAFTMKDITNKGVGCANHLSDLQASMRQRPILSSASAASTTTSSTTTSSTYTRTSEPQPASSTNPGAIAGGAVGGAAGAAILIALVWFVVRCRNKRRQGNEVRSMPSLSTNQTKQYLPQSKSWHQASPSELGAQKQQQIAELSGGPVTDQ